MRVLEQDAPSSSTRPSRSFLGILFRFADYFRKFDTQGIREPKKDIQARIALLRFDIRDHPLGNSRLLREACF